MSEEKKLTLRQERFVAEATDPSTKSMAQAARKAGYSEKVVYEVGSKNPRKPHVAKAIEIRRTQQTDKARGILGATERLMRRATTALGQIDDQQMTHDPILAGNLLRLLTDVREKELQVRERYGIDKSDDPAKVREQARQVQRLIVVAIQCAYERPAVAQRILERAEARPAIDESVEPERALHGRWEPCGYREG